MSALTPVASSAEFSKFLEEIAGDDGTSISPRLLAERLSIQLVDLAKFVGVHRNTLLTNPAASQVQKVLRTVVRVLSAATDVAGSVDRAVYWYRNHPIKDFDYRTPEDLVGA